MRSWTDIDFAKKRINLWRQISYKVGYGHFYQTLKNDSSTRFIIIDDSLLGELSRWQVQQVENEKVFGGSYVYIYIEEGGHLAAAFFAQILQTNA